MPLEERRVALFEVVRELLSRVLLEVAVIERVVLILVHDPVGERKDRRQVRVGTPSIEAIAVPATWAPRSRTKSTPPAHTCPSSTRSVVARTRSSIVWTAFGVNARLGIDRWICWIGGSSAIMFASE